MKINSTFWKTISRSLFCLLTGSLAASCSMMEEDLPECPQGLEIHFLYNYNLERADMFNDHVGAVTVYLFDESGNYLMQQSCANTSASAPLRANSYSMHFDVAPGKYKYLVVGWQKSYEECLRTSGAKFRLTEPSTGKTMEALSLTLDNNLRADGMYDVNNDGLTLDTLWHGIQNDAVEVVLDEVTHDTVSLVRDTKQINITLRDIELPSETDINDYEMVIYDHNATINWDNSVDETKQLVYTPYNTWNTEDKTDDETESAANAKATTTGTGRIAHADFMTSRIIYHDRIADDAILSVTNKNTGVEIIRVNLADLLSRLRTSADIHNYSEQEFLDRGYDYGLTFYLQGDRWKYVNVEISTLSWARRIQNEEL
ncbi:MAG: FimB/Mfa2 family fimbrial subunit [Bacteroidales bacterium]|nr:FimB/Mfa2 family fimbrial subunit [Bacteroidales bacterium]